MVGPIGRVKAEEGEPILERVLSTEPPEAVKESSTQSVASLEIPLVAAQLSEIQVGFSRKSCS